MYQNLFYMSTVQIRHSLYEYIRFADEKKIKAIYTIVEEEIKEKHEIWNDAFTKEMQRRANQIESGKVKGKSREEVASKAKALLNK
jgi:hypothetical protein